MIVKTREKGLAIVLVLMVLGILAIVVAAIVKLGSSSLALSHTENQSQLALFAAEAGLWQAVSDLRSDPTFVGFPETNMPNVRARFRVDIYTGGAGPRGPIPAGLHYIHAIGTSGLVGETGDLQIREIGMMVKHTNSAYVYGLFGEDTVVLFDGTTDNWDSSVGAYPAGQRLAQSHVGIQGVTGGSEVRLDAGTMVDGGLGNVHISVGAPFDRVRGAGLYGARIDQVTNFVMPIVDMDGEPTSTSDNVPSGGVTYTNGYLDPGTYGNVNVPAGTTLALREDATYYFHNLTFGPNSELALGNGANLPVSSNPATKRTVVKVRGNIRMILTSQLNNPSGQAHLLEFDVNGESVQPTNIVGGLDAYYVLKAPNSNVRLEAGDHFGAVIARGVTAGTGAGVTRYHYDVNLENTGIAPELPGGTGENNVLVVSYENF
jgi:hypothetical protein